MKKQSKENWSLLPDSVSGPVLCIQRMLTAEELCMIRCSCIDFYRSLGLAKWNNTTSCSPAFSRSQCYTVWSAIVRNLSPVHQSVCDTVHCSSRGCCTRLKVVSACS